MHPAQWGKKGSALYKVPNVTLYPELRVFTNRLLNRIGRLGGFVIVLSPSLNGESRNRLGASNIEADAPDVEHDCKPDHTLCELEFTFRVSAVSLTPRLGCKAGSFPEQIGVGAGARQLQLPRALAFLT